MASEHNDIPDRADQAVSARLRKLSAMPVDLSGVQRAIERQIPRQRQQRPVVMRLLRPITAVAASITLVAIIVAALVATSSNEVMASPAEMARFHQDIV